MGSRERRERERLETRQRILDAAREHFLTAGYEGTTMRAIARSIEYTPTAIYHHFESKEALLRELCDADFQMLGRALYRIGSIPDPVERVERLGAAYIEFGLERPEQYRFMFMAPRPPLSREELQSVGDPTVDAYAFLRDTCVELIASGRVREECHDPELLAQILWSGLHGIVSLWITKRDDAVIDLREPRLLADRMRDVLLRGILQ